MKTFAEKRFFKWEPDEISVSLRARSGSYGGGSEVLIVDTLVFDSIQITSKLNANHPTWGGCCHTLSQGNANGAVIIIKETKNELSERNRVSEPGSASRKLQRAGRI